MNVVQKESDWKSTGTQNLIIYQPSGTYFARFKVGRKLFRKSLDTQVFSTAKLRLRDKIHEHRASAEAGRGLKSGKSTFAQTMTVYLQGVDADVSLKPKSKLYRKMLCGLITKSWPDLPAMDVRKVSEWNCKQWLAAFQKKYSPTAVNNAIGTLRAIFQIAVDGGARFENPANALKKVKVLQKHLKLPSREQFEQFVEAIRTAGARQSKDCADLVRFLAYSGLRISEAGHVTWADVNFQRNELTVRGDPETGTKNSEIRLVPLIPQLTELLANLRKDRSGEPEKASVMRIRHCQRSMERAAKLVGMDRITHHDLRHLFATVCIENGCDIPTVSRWLGHKDGGALCMKTYGHLRQEHSKLQASRVAF